jgi:hypothetical protein
MTLSSVGLALKLRLESQGSLVAEGATPLRYFPKGPVKKEYVVTERIAADPELFFLWVAKSIRFSPVRVKGDAPAADEIAPYACASPSETFGELES